MEAIPQNPFLQFGPNTLYEIRKEFNLHESGSMDEVINNFEEWISKQSHFIKKDFTRDYLERSIILAKGSMERAKNTLEKLCTVKTLLPQYFATPDVNDLPDFSHIILPVFLPKLAPDNYRVSFVKLVSTDFGSEIHTNYYKFLMLLTEYIKFNDYTLGFHSVVDCRDINIVNLVLKLNLIELKQIMYILMEGHGMRVKGIHMISSSKTIETLVNLIKQLVISKIAGRIHVHRDIDTIHEYLPKEILPKEYGGEEKSLKSLHEDWRKVLVAKETVEYLKEISQAGTNEAQTDRHVQRPSSGDAGVIPIIKSGLIIKIKLINPT